MREVKSALLYARQEYARLHVPTTVARNRWRWALWAAVIVFTPVVGMAAYQPGWVLPTRAINTTSPLTGGGDMSGDRTIACATCATTTNGGAITGTAPVAVSAAGAISVPAATATVSGLVPTPPNDVTKVYLGTSTWGAAPAPAPVAPTIYTGTLPLTLANTDGLYEAIEMATPASGTINLPTSPTAGMRLCVKDGLKNFASNVATVKTTDSSTIDKVAGATGYAMNQNGQATCFKYASSGTNWYID